MAGEDDDLDPWLCFFNNARKRQTVEKGHANVRNEDVRFYILEYGKGHLAVGRLSHKGVLRFIPGYAVPDPFPDYHFIVNKKHTIHLGQPPER